VLAEGDRNPDLLSFPRWLGSVTRSIQIGGRRQLQHRRTVPLLDLHASTSTCPTQLPKGASGAAAQCSRRWRAGAATSRGRRICELRRRTAAPRCLCSSSTGLTELRERVARPRIAAACGSRSNYRRCQADLRAAPQAAAGVRAVAVVIRVRFYRKTEPNKPKPNASVFDFLNNRSVVTSWKTEIL
jgi:hypothetical protein